MQNNKKFHHRTERVETPENSCSIYTRNNIKSDQIFTWQLTQNYIEGNLVLLEAQEARWLTKQELDSVKWLPADLGQIDRIREQMR